MRYSALIVLALAGCATVPPSGDVLTTNLACGAVRLDINTDGRSAVIRNSDGGEIVLERAPSSLGTRYSGGGVSVLRSGDTYVYTGRDGATVNCARILR